MAEVEQNHEQGQMPSNAGMDYDDISEQNALVYHDDDQP